MDLLAAIDKVAFYVGDLPVEWYGIIIVIGMIAGLVIVCLECKRINLDSDDAIELFLWVIPLAVIFCRVFYVLARPDVYFPIESWDDFVDVIAIWEGGITIIGGLVGGLIGAGIFAFRKRKKCNFGNIVDLIVVPVALVLGVAYMLVCLTRSSFRTVNAAVIAGELDVTELSRFDVANYKFVTRLLARGGRFPRWFYGAEDIPVAELAEGDYIKKVKTSWKLPAHCRKKARGAAAKEKK